MRATVAWPGFVPTCPASPEPPRERRMSSGRAAGTQLTPDWPRSPPPPPVPAVTGCKGLAAAHNELRAGEAPASAAAPEVFTYPPGWLAARLPGWLTGSHLSSAFDSRLAAR